MQRPRRSGTFNSDDDSSARSAISSSPEAKSSHAQRGGIDSQLSTQHLISNDRASSRASEQHVSSDQRLSSATASVASNETRPGSQANLVIDSQGDDINSQRPSKRRRSAEPTEPSLFDSGSSPRRMAVDSAKEIFPEDQASTERRQLAMENTEVDIERSTDSATPSDQESRSREQSTPLQNGYPSNSQISTTQSNQHKEALIANALNPTRRFGLQRLLRMETPADSIGATSGQVTPMVASPTEPDQENDQDLADDPSAASGKPAKPLRRLPGRRRAPHPDRNVEADLRRQLQLKVGYRAVAKALKPVLAELVSRTIDSVQEDPEAHRASKQYTIVQSQLDTRLRHRVAVLNHTYTIKSTNARDLRDSDIDKLQSICKNTIRDLREEYSARAEHQFLIVKRDAEMVFDDGSKTVDEDGFLPHLRGRNGPLPPEYDSRSRFFVETERLWMKEEDRRSFAEMVEEYLSQNPENLDVEFIKNLDLFVGFDEAHRGFAVASANIRALAQAAEILQSAPQAVPTQSPQIIPNIEAQGLQMLAELSLQSGSAQNNSQLAGSAFPSHGHLLSQQGDQSLVDPYLVSQPQHQATSFTSFTSTVRAPLETSFSQHNFGSSVVEQESHQDRQDAHGQCSTYQSLIQSPSGKRNLRPRHVFNESTATVEREPGLDSNAVVVSAGCQSHNVADSLPENSVSKSNKITDLLNNDVVVKIESPSSLLYASPSSQTATTYVASPGMQRVNQVSAIGSYESFLDKESHNHALEYSDDHQVSTAKTRGNPHLGGGSQPSSLVAPKTNGFWSALTTPSGDTRNKESASRQTRYEALLRSSSKARTRTPERTSSQPSDASSDQGQGKRFIHLPPMRIEPVVISQQVPDTQSPGTSFKRHRGTGSIDGALRPWSRGEEDAQEPDRRPSIAASPKYNSRSNTTPRFSPLAPHPGTYQLPPYSGSPPAQQYTGAYSGSSSNHAQMPQPAAFPLSSQYASPYNQFSAIGSRYDSPPATSDTYWPTSRSGPPTAIVANPHGAISSSSFQLSATSSYSPTASNPHSQHYEGYTASVGRGPSPHLAQVAPTGFGQQFGGQPILPANQDPRTKQHTSVTHPPAFSQGPPEPSPRPSSDHRRAPSEPKARQKDRQQNEFRRYSGPPASRN